MAANVDLGMLRCKVVATRDLMSYVMAIDFHCLNCDNNWSEKFKRFDSVNEETDYAGRSSVIVRYKNIILRKISCPNCENKRTVLIMNRKVEVNGG